jgi:hypothetical protein
MSSRDGLIVERTQDWLVLIGTQTERLASDVPVSAIVETVQRLTQAENVRSPRCLIAPAATSCFFVSLRGDDLPDLRDRRALTYELESHVPLDAEAMVADFAPAPSVTQERSQSKQRDPDVNQRPAHSQHAISAVAIEIGRWKELADALEASGFAVAHIVPAPLLAARALTENAEAREWTELLLVEGRECDAITLRGDQMSAWKHLSLDPDSLRLHRQLDSRTVSHAIAVGADGTQLELMRNTFQETPLRINEESLEALWRRGSELSFAKHTSHWFDLRREQLGPGDPFRPIAPQLRRVTIAALVFLVAIMIGSRLRSRRIEAAIDRVSAQQRADFQEVFPNASVPAALVRRVRSEHTKVVGSRAASTELELPVSATEVLRELLTALPSSVRFRMTSLKINNGQVDIDLQVRTAVDAGLLASALQSHGFEVEPPVTTRQDAKTFQSVLEAKWSGGSRASAESPLPTSNQSESRPSVPTRPGDGEESSDRRDVDKGLWLVNATHPGDKKRFADREPKP